MEEVRPSGNLKEKTACRELTQKFKGIQKDENKKKNIWTKQRKKNKAAERRVIAVAYTHLDVYKRQDSQGQIRDNSFAQ